MDYAARLSVKGVEFIESGQALPEPELPREIRERKVYLVRGASTDARDVATVFLEQLDLQPIQLHERAESGKSITEQAEAHSNVLFAIVLLTADELGHTSGSSDLRPPMIRCWNLATSSVVWAGPRSARWAWDARARYPRIWPAWFWSHSMRPGRGNWR